MFNLETTDKDKKNDLSYLKQTYLPYNKTNLLT